MTWSQNYSPIADSIGLSATGTWLLVAGVIAGLLPGLKPGQLDEHGLQQVLFNLPA